MKPASVCSSRAPTRSNSESLPRHKARHLELTDQIRIRAPRERVFAALNDVDILKQAIPGCEEIEALSDTQFQATVAARVGPLKARFKGQVTMSDIVPPESYTLSGEGRGGPAGHAKIRSSVRLSEDGEATLLAYDVKADIGGKLAQLGGALVQNTAQKLAAEFFHNFEAILAPAAPDDEGQPAAVTADTESAGFNWMWLGAAGLVALAIAWLVL